MLPTNSNLEVGEEKAVKMTLNWWDFAFYKRGNIGGDGRECVGGD